MEDLSKDLRSTPAADAVLVILGITLHPKTLNPESGHHGGCCPGCMA